MLSDEELGVALSEALHGLVGDVEPSAALLERVFTNPHAPAPKSRSATSRRLRRGAFASVPVGIAAAIATAVIVLGGSSVTASFAVTSGSDGSITITIDDLTGVGGANARLRELGVPVVVVAVSATCTTHLDLSYIGTSEQPEPSIRLIPSEIPAGSTVVLAASQNRANNVEMEIGSVTGSPPSCVSPASAEVGSGPP
jgi:hypothetical protein